MAKKAKHAFGAREQISNALAANKIDAYDILFVKDAKGKPFVGWVDAEGNSVIVEDTAELAALETQISTKANAEEVNAAIATKADATKVEAELATKADAKEVETKIADTVANVNAYTDKMVAAAMGEHLTKKYEVTDVPEGTLVDYRDNEIRILCPKGTKFTKQSVGTGGDVNTYYMTFRTYFPENAVGYIEHLNGQADKEILTSFSIDEHGRRYQPTWLGLAKYDVSTDTWNYYGASSTSNRMIGWDYQIDFYNAEGVMIASDGVRISLANEDCYSEIKPYYVGTMMTEVETMIAKATASAIEVVEF